MIVLLDNACANLGYTVRFSKYSEGTTMLKRLQDEHNLLRYNTHNKTKIWVVYGQTPYRFLFPKEEQSQVKHALLFCVRIYWRIFGEIFKNLSHWDAYSGH